jgi:hypothetical protein
MKPQLKLLTNESEILRTIYVKVDFVEEKVVLRVVQTITCNIISFVRIQNLRTRGLWYY